MADEQAKTESTGPADQSAAPAAAATGAAPAPVAEAPVQEKPKVVYPPSSKSGGFYWGTGRRKTSVARIRLKPGTGKIEVNGRTVDDYFHEPKDRNNVYAPLRTTDTMDKFDVFANVMGGGFTGQGGAILLGISRALMTVNDTFEQPLRDAGYLTRDSRMKERKKYGQKGARKRFQFSKR